MASGSPPPDRPDRELLDAAADFFSALVLGGPDEDITDHEDAPAALASYVALLGRQASTVADLAAAFSIGDFLERQEDWDHREALLATCREVTARPGWPERIAVGLHDADPVVFGLAARSARRFGIDTYDAYLVRVRSDPTGTAWLHAWSQADPARAEELIALVHELLPLEQVPTGATDSRAAGPEWAVHRALDWTLQFLPRHVGLGSDLVALGLRSPVVTNRLRALETLQAWPRAEWPRGGDRAGQLDRHG